MNSEQEKLATLVRAQAAEMEAWQAAELHLLAGAFRGRLEHLGVAPTPEVAVSLMAVAQLMAEHSPEWGGDVRCALAELARLGLELLAGPPGAGT